MHASSVLTQSLQPLGDGSLCREKNCSSIALLWQKPCPSLRLLRFSYLELLEDLPLQHRPVTVLEASVTPTFAHYAGEDEVPVHRCNPEKE